MTSKMKAIKSLDADDRRRRRDLWRPSRTGRTSRTSRRQRVLNYIDETLGPEEDDRKSMSRRRMPEDEADENDEPWEGYDKATAAQIKKVLTDAKDDDDEPLTARAGRVRP